MNDLADNDIYKEIGKIVSQFDLYQCYDCAMTEAEWIEDFHCLSDRFTIAELGD